MCSAREATVREVAARDLVSALARHLKDARVIRTPNKFKQSDQLMDMYFGEAAELLRLYYMHPSIVPPAVCRRKPRTERETAELFRLAVRKCGYDELVRVGWVVCDDSCKLILVTELGRQEMDRIAASLKRPVKEPDIE